MSLGFIPREIVESPEAKALFPNAEQPQEPDEKAEAEGDEALKERLTAVRKVMNKFAKINMYMERCSTDESMEFGGSDDEEAKGLAGRR